MRRPTLLRSPGSPRVTQAQRPPCSRESGITLIEVLIAILVFSIGMLGLASAIPFGMNRVTDSAGDTRASELAAECSERLLVTPYADAELSTGTHTDSGNPRDGLWNVSWNVEANQPLTSCKRITVSVQRTNGLVPRARLVIVMPQSGG